MVYPFGTKSHFVGFLYACKWRNMKRHSKVIRLSPFCQRWMYGSMLSYTLKISCLIPRSVLHLFHAANDYSIKKPNDQFSIRCELFSCQFRWIFIWHETTCFHHNNQWYQSHTARTIDYKENSSYTQHSAFTPLKNPLHHTLLHGRAIKHKTPLQISDFFAGVYYEIFFSEARSLAAICC